MDLAFLATNILTGLAYGALLFMISVGFSIIFGFMNIVNIAHGAFYVLGAYIGFSLLSLNLGFWLALILATLAMALCGVFVERFLLSRTYGNELNQILLTFGLAFVFGDLAESVWGTNPKTLPTPSALQFTMTLGNVEFPAYRLFVVLVGLLMTILVWYFETRTRIGAIIRAGVDDRNMVPALGVNVTLVFAGVFAFGAGMAGLGGVLGGPILGIYPDQGFDILILALIVVVLGGLGTWKGALAGALVVGMVQTLGQVYFPSLALVIVFLLMVAVLLIRPSGLFGREAAT